MKVSEINKFVTVVNSTSLFVQYFTSEKARIKHSCCIDTYSTMSKTQLVENCYKNRSFYIMRGADSEHFSPIPEVDSDFNCLTTDNRQDTYTK